MGRFSFIEREQLFLRARRTSGLCRSRCRLHCGGVRLASGFNRGGIIGLRRLARGNEGCVRRLHRGCVIGPRRFHGRRARRRISVRPCGGHRRVARRHRGSLCARKRGPGGGKRGIPSGPGGRHCRIACGPRRRESCPICRGRRNETGSASLCRAIRRR